MWNFATHEYAHLFAFLPPSLPPSLSPSLPPSLTHSLSLPHSLTHSLTHALSPSLPPSLPPSPPLSLTCRPRWNWVPSHQVIYGQPAIHSCTNLVFQIQDVAKPRLILFVVGGITHSEIRAAYEVTRKFLTHDVLIGEIL